MIKLISLTGWTALVAVMFSIETPPLWLEAIAGIIAFGLIWLGNALAEEVHAHKYRVQGAPIASQVARKQKFEVKL
jgi:hypothetical protein